VHHEVYTGRARIDAVDEEASRADMERRQ